MKNNKKTFKSLRQLMMWQMLPHMVLGHPFAALLSRLGFKDLAERFHWRTLPSRGRRKIAREQIDFVHHRDVFWTDFLFIPIPHLLGTLGFHYLGYRFFMLNPFVNQAIEHSTHLNFLLWANYSRDKAEREKAHDLLVYGRQVRAELAIEGHLRYPHITMLPDVKQTRL